jgi:hypothetical protein
VASASPAWRPRSRLPILIGPGYVDQKMSFGRVINMVKQNTNTVAQGLERESGQGVQAIRSDEMTQNTEGSQRAAGLINLSTIRRQGCYRCTGQSNNSHVISTGHLSILPDPIHSMTTNYQSAFSMSLSVGFLARRLIAVRAACEKA